MNIGIDLEFIGSIFVSILLVAMYFKEKNDRAETIKAFFSKYIYIPSLFLSAWFMLLSILFLGYGLDSWVYSFLSKVISFLAGTVITCILVKIIIDNFIEKSMNIKRDIWGVVTIILMLIFVKLLDNHTDFGLWLLKFMTPQTGSDPALKVVGDCFAILALFVSPPWYAYMANKKR